MEWKIAAGLPVYHGFYILHVFTLEYTEILQMFQPIDANCGIVHLHIAH